MFIDYHYLLEYDDCYILRKELKEFLFKSIESNKILYLPFIRNNKLISIN